MYEIDIVIMDWYGINIYGIIFDIFFLDLKLMLYLSKINLVIGYFLMNFLKLKY